jgi:hypothetical protein
MFFAILSRCNVIIASAAMVTALFAATDPNNVVSNGDFSDGETGWTIYAKAVHGAAATCSVIEGQLVCDVTKANAYWDVNMYHNKVTVETGTTYVLTFEAKADKDRTIVFAVESNDGQTEYNPNGGGKNPINLTTTMQTFTSTFTMAKPTDNNARVNMNVGASVSKVYFDNVSLIDKSKIVAISPRSAIRAGSDNFQISTDSRGYPSGFPIQLISGFKSTRHQERPLQNQLRSTTVLLRNTASITDPWGSPPGPISCGPWMDINNIRQSFPCCPEFISSIAIPKAESVLIVM